MPHHIAAALWLVAQIAPTENPVAWFTSLGAFVPTAAVLWYLYADTRKDRDRYRELVFDMLPAHRDAMQSAALSQERLAEAVEARLLTETELIKLRRLLERAQRRESQ